MANFPHSEFHDIESIELTEAPVSDLTINYQGMRLDCRLNQKVKNDYLIVTPNGAVDREKVALPAFARWNWHGIFKGSILAISDPSLYFKEDLPIGWFAGSKYLNTTSFVADVVCKIASLLQIPNQKIIFWGSSAGGYASILLAGKIDSASFVSVNGQTQIINYYSGHIEHFRKQFDSGSSAEELAKSYPEQWSAIFALQKSYDDNKATRGLIVQNTTDKKHYNEHYLPFCEHFNLSIEGGLNEDYDLSSMLFTHEKGHGPEPADIAKEIIATYLPKLISL